MPVDPEARMRAIRAQLTAVQDSIPPPGIERNIPWPTTIADTVRRMERLLAQIVEELEARNAL